jgi:hypothetical protein
MGTSGHRNYRVEVVYFEGCPHWQTALDHVTEALRQVDAGGEVQLQLVANEEEAKARHMAGSPTVLIDGVDPFPGGGPAWGCRIYPGEDGASGAPSVSALVEVLR